MAAAQDTDKAYRQSGRVAILEAERIPGPAALDPTTRRRRELLDRTEGSQPRPTPVTFLLRSVPADAGVPPGGSEPTDRSERDREDWRALVRLVRGWVEEILQLGPGNRLIIGDEIHHVLHVVQELGREASFTVIADLSLDMINDIGEQDGAISVVSIGLPVPDVLVPGRAFAEQALLREPSLHRAEPVAISVERSAEDDGRDVIVAIIDAGIGFANSRFRKQPHSTRFAAVWIMDAANLGDPDTAPAIMGRKFDKGRIDAALAAARGDDAQAYRTLEVLDPRVKVGQPLMFSGTHGTHVLDIAAGSDYRSSDPAEQDGVAHHPLIAVQLPRDVVADTSGRFLTQVIAAALTWIASEAEKLADDDEPLPLVLNFSFGVTAGPADGNDDVEHAIRCFVDSYNARAGEPRCHAVVAAGNSYDARLVASVALPAPGTAGDPEVLNWRIQPDDKTPSFVEIWLPPRASASAGAALQQIEVQLKPPFFELGTDYWSKSGFRHRLLHAGTEFAGVVHTTVKDMVTDTVRERIVLNVDPTAFHTDQIPLAPAGIWQVKINNLRLAEGERIVCRIQRDDGMPSFRAAGRQSYFDMPDYHRYAPDSQRPVADLPMDQQEALSGETVSRARTLNEFVSTVGPIVAVGGYRHSDGHPARYSSAGPAVHTGRNGPDAAAVSDDSATHRGVLASGTLSGTTFIQGGTSVAAPAFARRLATSMRAPVPAPAEVAYAEAIATISSHESAGPEGPHGSYPPLAPPAGSDNFAPATRLGSGRLPRPGIPAHRRRLDP